MFVPTSWQPWVALTVSTTNGGTTPTTTTTLPDTTTTAVPPSGGQSVSVARTAVTPAVTVTPGDRRLSFEWSHPDGRQFQLRTRVTGRNGWSWNPPTTDGCGAQRSCGWDVV